MLRFEHARPDDRNELAILLFENGMEYADPIEDFMLARQDDGIVGCVRIEDYHDAAVVRSLVVAKDFRNRGIGRYLLELILPSGKPTMVVARGEAVEFYKVLGFTITDWQAIPNNQASECISCPDRTECRPQPMILRS